MENADTTPTKITEETAAELLGYFDEIPEGLTAERFAEIWNVIGLRNIGDTTMKLYVMKPVLTQVPIIWTARIRRDLVPARRRTPAWRMEIKARRQRWKEIENDPRIKMLGKMIEEITKRWPQEAPTDGREGKPVEFRRFVRIPPMAATLIETEERNNHGTDDADAQEPD